MGSVKDLEAVKEPTLSRMGVGRFHFSDRYSVFDWGRMPDEIDGKGAGLCLMSAYCFEKLGESGVNSHYRGLIDNDGKLETFDSLERPTAVMEFDLVNVVTPRVHQCEEGLKYDYSRFTPNLANYLIPLEIIYRNALPQGSSVFTRLEAGTVTVEELDLSHHPKPGEKLFHPILDVSTKLEEKDRYLSWEEAKRIAGLTDADIEDIKRLLLKVDETVTRITSRAGFENEDGKIELAFDPDRKLIVVDAVGTLDECRFSYEGLHVGKEMVREFYRRTAWYGDVEDAKKRAEKTGVKDWRKICPTTPLRLDPSLKTILSHIYMAATNELTCSKMFDVASFSQVIRRYRDYVGAV